MILIEFRAFCFQLTVKISRAQHILHFTVSGLQVMGYDLLFQGCRVICYILLFQGCKVIGYAGSEEKVKFLKDLEFDLAFNYRKVNLSESLKEAAPEGVDVFYDGVFIFTVFV